MKVLFLSIGSLENIKENGLYQDLIRCFRDNNHEVFVVSSREKRMGKPTQFETIDNIHTLRVRTGNITKTSFIEKGISMLTISYFFKKAIFKFLKNEKFDLILYATPPITIASLINKIKKRDNSITYLMLKDIFPQNALDLEILNRRGLKSLITRYFFLIERKLYRTSDYIGCMSPRNIEFLLQNNSYINMDTVGLCPNAIKSVVSTKNNKTEMRIKFGLPNDKTIFLYGGNFGKPQNVDFIIKSLEICNELMNCHFVMCGSGTEFYKLEELKDDEKRNLSVFQSLSKSEYGELVDAADVGMIFLDYRFTIPNFPSRLLDYLDHEVPILACTDTSTDIGEIITDNGFGWWCTSDEPNNFFNSVVNILKEIDQIELKGKLGKEYLLHHFTPDVAYNEIINKIK